MPLSDQEVAQRFEPLYRRFQHAERVQSEKPLLAHYTSLETAEKILETNELWFSNPLFMNDWEEMRFGINQGIMLLDRTSHVRTALKQDRRIQLFKQAFGHFFEQLDKVQLLDVYVFCLSEHKPNNDDGLLSMWRGYGGHGRGTALVFDTSNLRFVPGAPMYLCKVEYGNHEERTATLEELLRGWASIVEQTEISDQQIPIAAHNALSLFKFYGLTSKHVGFLEEQEWRIIYLADLDANKTLEPRFSYALGAQGVEPKLKFKFERHSAGSYPEHNLGDLLHKIVLGPSVSSPLAKMAFIRMLQKIGRQEYSNRVVASRIPLRPAHLGH
jgi:hypothetical protein